MVYEGFLDKVGSTPVVHITLKEFDNINLYVKQEFMNPSGSVKDRAADHIIRTLLETGEINSETTIIESSSGNFGIALATFCKKYGLTFLCVINPNISPINEAIIHSMEAKVIKVMEPDAYGGFLKTRINKVQELLREIPNSYWINQYGNTLNSSAYYYTLGEEICRQVSDVDYVFLGVSSGGTITGVSQKVKERCPKAKIIAVDIVGSVIFGGPGKKRYIPGIGSSMVPDIIRNARIDDVVMVDEVSTVKSCHEIARDHFILAGGSSGSVLYAVKQYFKNKRFIRKPNVVMIFADRGDRYVNTVYNEAWCTRFFHSQSESIGSYILSEYQNDKKNVLV